jgi:hypothetical protein
VRDWPGIDYNNTTVTDRRFRTRGCAAKKPRPRKPYPVMGGTGQRKDPFCLNHTTNSYTTYPYLIQVKPTTGDWNAY